MVLTNHNCVRVNDVLLNCKQVANAMLYAAEGDTLNAAISVAGMVPVLGEAAVGAKLLNKGAKAVKKASAVSDLGKQAIKHADEIPGHCKQLKNGLKTGCFTAGTQVVVGAEYDENGVFVQYVTVNIEDIKVGDLVYSYNTLTGETELREVTKTVSLQSNHINYLTIEDEFGVEQVIESTDIHPFWVVTDNPDLDRAARDYAFENGAWFEHGNLEITEYGYWVEAKDLRVGDVFLGANGELSTLTGILRVEQSGGINVFNFSVDGNHNYFILAKEYDFGQTTVLVHNSNLCGVPGDKAVQVTSNIRASKGLTRAAEDAGKRVQKDLDHLVHELQKGNPNPGIGTKHVLKDIFEARTKDGARVYYRKVGEGIEIVAKSDKKNQPQVINLLRDLYSN